METSNSNSTLSSRLNQKYSDQFCNQESPDQIERKYKKFSEDLTDQISSEQKAKTQILNNTNSKLNLFQRKRFPTLTPLMTPRIASSFLSTTASSINSHQSVNSPPKLNNNFKQVSKLGKGLQALGCFKCIDTRINETVAIKEIKNADEEITAHFKGEYRIMQKLDHENIVKAKELIIQEETCQLVMEYAEGKQLGHYLEKLTEIQIIPIAKQILSALTYLHDKKIMHRDLHFNNIMYQKMNQNVKLIDFGIAKELREKIFGASCAGGIEYRAPEMLRYMPYTCKIDCWQAGLILLQLINHRKTSSQNVIKKIENSKPLFKNPISPAFKTLIEFLLTINYEKRISAKDALIILDTIQLKTN